MDRRGKIQQLIRRYINSILVRQASSGEPIPLREIALSEHFHTTRTTVQAACRELIADGTLIRIPGRRGLFINSNSPSCRSTGTEFRILRWDGREQFLGFAPQFMVNGFSSGFDDFHTGFWYSELLSSEPDQIIQELMEIPCYAYLWICPAPDLFPVTEKLIDAGFPVVVIGSYDNSHIPVPPSNTILFDYEGPGLDRAEWIHKNHFRRPLIYSGCSETVSALSLRLESYGQKLPADSVVWFPAASDIREKLPKAIHKFNPDCLVADGMIFTTFDLLAADLPELKKIPVYFDNSPWSIQLRNRHPELKIHVSRISYSKLMFDIGACAAGIMRILLKKPGRFQNGKVSDFLDFNESLIQYQPNMKGPKA